MTRTKLIRRIYFELRQSVGSGVSQAEILRCAAKLVKLHSGEDNGPRLDSRTGGYPFSMWSLDRAYADGGWRVLKYEREYELDMDREDAMERKMRNGLTKLIRGLAI